MTRRSAQRLRPDGGRCIEHKVPFRTRINYRLILRWPGSTTESCSFRDNLQTFNIGGIAMKLPPDQAGNPIPFLHSGAFEHPVLRLRYHPVASTGYRSDVSVAHQHSFVRSSLG